jgi:hypothetical protein
MAILPRVFPLLIFQQTSAGEEHRQTVSVGRVSFIHSLAAQAVGLELSILNKICFDWCSSGNRFQEGIFSCRGHGDVSGFIQDTEKADLDAGIPVLETEASLTAPLVTISACEGKGVSHGNLDIINSKNSTGAGDIAPSSSSFKALATFPMTADGVYGNNSQSTLQGPKWRMIADGEVISVPEPPQPSEPRPPQISKASHSHLVLACIALALASVQGDIRGKHIQEKAAANAQVVTPMGAFLLRKAFAAVEGTQFNAAGTQFACFTVTKV